MSTTNTPANPPLRLRAGGTYVTRDGRKVGPLLAGPGGYRDDYAFHVQGPLPDGPVSPAWTADGRYFFDKSTETPMDLTAEWAEPDRQAPTPVQTHTTVRTVIAPGTYGRVHVDSIQPSGGRDRLSITLTDMGGGLSLIRQHLTAEELRAAAATLTDLAAGLDRIAAETNKENQK